MSNQFFSDISYLLKEEHVKSNTTITLLIKGTQVKYHKVSKKSTETKIFLEEYAILICDNHKIPVHSLVEVRTGHLTSQFMKSDNDDNENRCISLIYKDIDHNNTNNYDLRCLDLEFANEKLAEEWEKAFGYLISKISEIPGDIAEYSRAWSAFKKDKLNEKDVIKLLESLNFDTSSKAIKEKMLNFDDNGDKHLDSREFLQFIEDLKQYKCVRELYKVGKISTAETFKKFLNEVQGEEKSLEECERLIRKYEGDKKVFSQSGFTNYIVSEDNLAMDPQKAKIYQDMDQPLSHYFIDSSHNTYLSGHQLKGESSIEMYSLALKRGCRCVELDVWDGEDGEPMIKHGYTLTSRIDLRDACKIIQSHAFLTNPYPVILSIENHTTKPQQDKMAEIFEEIFDKQLASPSLLNHVSHLLSPNQLKGKFLLKGTMFSSLSDVDPERMTGLSEINQSGVIEVDLEQSDSDSEEENDNKKDTLSSSSSHNSNKSDKKSPKEGLKEPSKKDPKKSPNTEEKGEKEDKEKPGFFKRLTSKKIEKKHTKKEKEGEGEKKKIEKISERLAKLIFLKSTSFKNFEKSLQQKCYEMCSFSEGITNKGFHKEHQEYNKEHLSRIYPKGTRFDSSNYDPIPHWNCRSQIVALNYQTSSAPMKINRGKFRENGRTGYVLQHDYNPKHQELKHTKLNVRVIGARQLPRTGETSDVYCSVSLHGPEKDQKMDTEVVDNNGFNPEWNVEFSFDISNAAFCILLFELKDKDVVGHKYIAHYALPIHCVRTGYRVIQLEDSVDNKIFNGSASLLCHFSFK